MRSHYQTLLLSTTLAFAGIGLSGCADLTHYTYTRQAHSNMQDISYMDAKQRVVLSTKYKATADGVEQIRTCAEPSPDALSAIAASQSGSFTDGTKEISAKNSLAESVSSIGLRTQSIQLMRDSMYRLCEAYMSGALNDLTYQTMQRRFQSSMVAILAIEQLTGVVRAPAVTIVGQASSGNAELVAKYTELTGAAKTKLRAAEKARDDYIAGDYKTAKTAKDTKETAIKATNNNTTNVLTAADKADLSASDEGKAFVTAEKKKADLEEAATNEKSAHDNANKARLAALNGNVSVASTADLEVINKAALSEASVTAVATAVQNIVQQTLGLGFSRELCPSVLLRDKGGANADDGSSGNSANKIKSVRQGCLEFLGAAVNGAYAKVESQQVTNNAVNELADRLKQLKDLSSPTVTEKQDLIDTTARLAKVLEEQAKTKTDFNMFQFESIAGE